MTQCSLFVITTHFVLRFLAED